VTEKYLADRKDSGAYYIHFAFNPKPWQMRTRYALQFYPQVLETVAYGTTAGWLPRFAPLPYTLQRRYRWLCYLLAPLGANVARLKKLRRKISARRSRSCSA